MHTLADLRAGRLAGSTRLDLSCELRQFPDEIFSLSDTLEVLNLTGNQLSELPADLHRLKRLKVLFCSNNLFTELPQALGGCAQLFFVGFKACKIKHVSPRSLPPLLRSLVLTDNHIDALPDELGQCRHLQKLMMAGNRLRSLPPSLAACERLELVRISANQLTELPAWLLQMPALAWLAFAGNPLNDIHNDIHAETPVRLIPWSQLNLHKVLGEGASGVIQQGEWQDEAGVSHEVAVKLYKGDLTSDGSPLNELAACIAAGQHRHLIPIEGQICAHPQNVRGLVMPLIDPRFTPLAAPPSLESCTRDVYRDVRIDATAVRHIAAGIAAACAHLHARGINHGDLYAHNILWDESGDNLLGDFGAAAFYPDSDTGRILERIEVRAFGILLDELLNLCAGESVQRVLLQDLQRRCVAPYLMSRPSFAELETLLEA